MIPDITVLQFGEGNFLRAFFDWMLQQINDSCGMDHGVFLVQPIPEGRVKVLLDRPEYTVWLRGMEGGRLQERLERVRVIRDGVNPFEDFGKLLRAAEAPGLRLVVSNTTEAGIHYAPQGVEAPRTFPAMLTRALFARFRQQGSPLAVLPFELIERNGQTLKAYVLKHALDWDYPAAFRDYVDACRFYDTLVDRIVPGYPKDEADELSRRIGGPDPNAVCGEWFHLLVIEGEDGPVFEAFPFRKAGLNVIFTDRLSFYRERKVRVLNGCHTGSVGTGLLGGVELVRDFALHPTYGQRLRTLAHEEIVRAFSDNEETHGYAEQVLERFQNPSIQHSLRAIALNSIAKMNTRVRPTLVDYHRTFGRWPALMLEGVADMVELYRRGPVAALPKGPFELADFAQLPGTSTREILAAFFPGLEGVLLDDMAHAVEAIRPARAA